MLGEDSAAVLAEHGYSEADIAALIAEGAVGGAAVDGSEAQR